MTPLGSLETVVFVLDSLEGEEGYPSINIQNSDGRTAIFDAKDPKTLTLLLWNGADPH